MKAGFCTAVVDAAHVAIEKRMRGGGEGGGGGVFEFLSTRSSISRISIRHSDIQTFSRDGGVDRRPSALQSDIFDSRDIRHLGCGL